MDNKESFNVEIIKQTMNSVTIDWNSITNANVYKIEKFHKRRGWEKCVWISKGPAIVENLEENFAYRLRIIALTFDEADKLYVALQTSSDILVTTITAPPTTISLYRAIRKGEQFLVKRILRRRPSLIEYPSPNGYLPLANAIISGDNCIIDILLTAGASVHIGNPQTGRTPLHLAFWYGRLPVARILLNKKANVNAGDINGMNACHFAVDANQLEILRFALENAEANLEAKDACGWTLLLRAVVMRADVGILKLLVTSGANMKAKDKLGQSCVSLARLYRNEEAGKYLQKICEGLQRL